MGADISSPLVGSIEYDTNMASLVFLRRVTKSLEVELAYPETEIDKIAHEMGELTKAYATRAESLARDPYYREAIVKIAVSSFVWALFHAFKDDRMARQALNNELKVQSAAIDRAVGTSTH